MIVAIERTKFTYLYKYNQIRVDISQLIDKSTDDLKGMLSNDLSNLTQLFNKALPLFEQDHEVILLEIDKSKINLQDGILISFDSIHSIYPLTKKGFQLLEGKINDDFILELPIFENAIEDLRLRRSMAYRRSTSVKLLIHFNLGEFLNNSMLSLIGSSVEKNLLDKSKTQVFNTFLDHLFAYNKTPSYIPDGNIEHICKIGAIAIKYMGRPEDVFTNGPFYKASIKYKSKINSHSFLAAYLDFTSIADIELKSSIEKMIDIISKDYIGIDIFKVSFFFLAFKSFLNKHDNNIELLNNEIEALIANDKQCASFVLAMLGYAFSIESIYEGLHKMSNAPLLKSTQSKISAEIEKHKRIVTEIEKKKDLEKAAIEQEMIRLRQLIHIEENKTKVGENVAVITDEEAVEATVENAVETAVEAAVEEAVEAPVEEAVEAPVEEAVEAPVKEAMEEALEEAVEVVIHAPIETVSEPIVLYEDTEKFDLLEDDKTIQLDIEEIKSSTDSIEPNSKKIKNKR